MYSEKYLHELGGETNKSFRDIRDPNYVGPGTWISIHKSSLYLTADEFIKFVNGLQRSFSCANCKEHFGDYLKEKPPSKYKNIKIRYHNKTLDLGMFLWSWEFHNAVNKRLGKPILSWESACQLFVDENFDGVECSKSCQISH